MLGHIRSALKPGGRLVLIEYKGEDPSIPILPSHKMTVAQAKLEVEHEGFVLTTTDSSLPRQHVLIFTKKPLEQVAAWALSRWTGRPRPGTVYRPGGQGCAVRRHCRRRRVAATSTPLDPVDPDESAGSARRRGAGPRRDAGAAASTGSRFDTADARVAAAIDDAAVAAGLGVGAPCRRPGSMTTKPGPL